MHYTDIGSFAQSALLSLYINKKESKLSNEAYLRQFLSNSSKLKRLSEVASKYFHELLNTARANPISFKLEKILSELAENSIEVRKHLDQFDSPMKERLVKFSEDLDKKGFLNLCNFKDKKENLPSADEAILVMSSEFEKFDSNGNLTDNITVRIKTNDLYIVAKTAYDNGIVLFKTAQGDGMYDFSVCVDNNAKGPAFPIRGREAFEEKQKQLALMFVNRGTLKMQTVGRNKSKRKRR